MSDPNVLEMVQGGGEYRLRVSARGRDDGARAFSAGEDDAEPVEFYLLETWPESQSPAKIIKLTSSHARNTQARLDGGEHVVSVA